MRPTRWVVTVALMTVVTGVFTGLSASAAPPKSLTWDSTTISIVSPGDQAGVWNTADSTYDGRFDLLLYNRVSDRLVQVSLRDTKNGNAWNTVPPSVGGDPAWGLGVTAHGSTTLLNNADTSLPNTAAFTFVGTKTFDLWAASSAGSYSTWFASGRTFVVTAVFSSGRTVRVRETIP